MNPPIDRATLDAAASAFRDFADRFDAYDLEGGAPLSDLLPAFLEFRIALDMMIKAAS